MLILACMSLLRTPFQVNHGRGYIAVAHPLLEGSDIDAVLEVPGRVSVAEFMQKPPRAERPGGTAVGFDGSVGEGMPDGAVGTIQFAAPRDSLQFLQHGAVGAAGFTGEDRIVRGCALGPEHFKHGDQFLGTGTSRSSQFLGLKSQWGLAVTRIAVWRKSTSRQS